MNIVAFRKIYFLVSIILLTASIFSLAFYGLSLGIDFTGGSLMEVVFEPERPNSDQIKEKLSDLDLGQIDLRTVGDQGLILRFKEVGEETHQEILHKLGISQDQEQRFESVGPVIGQELKTKAIWAILLALIAIIGYIAWSFRRVSRPVASWQYGLVAIIALFHDLVITLGIFSWLSHLWGFEIDLALVAAFLTILGYSVNNSIVIFDRVRENLLRVNWENFDQVINQSINQSLTRCINTALTTLFVLLAIFFLGGESIKYFALALILGIVIGTYSSIFITSPLVLSLYYRRLDEE